MGTLLICLLALPSVAGERTAKSPGTIAARRAAARPSAMAVRRAGPAPGAFAPAPASAPSQPAPATPAAVPAAPADPEFGPRITSPLGSPTGGIDLRKDRGVSYVAPASAQPEPPHPPIGAEGAAGAGPERAPSGVKGSAVVELRAGRTDRQFGGATDPVLFLMGGTGPSGSINTTSSSSSESLGLTVTLGAPR